MAESTPKARTEDNSLDAHYYKSGQLDIEKWRKEIEWHEVELRLKERELDLKAQEQDRLAMEAKRSRLWNPLFLGVVAAVIAATGGAATSILNGVATTRTELLKAESARIFEAIKAGDSEKAKENLRFLAAVGLIEAATATKIQAYLDIQPTGAGPFLPASIDSNPVRLKREIDVLSRLDAMTRSRGNTDKISPN
jgi:hypothetical protein